MNFVFQGVHFQLIPFRFGREYHQKRSALPEPGITMVRGKKHDVRFKVLQKFITPSWHLITKMWWFLLQKKVATGCFVRFILPAHQPEKKNSWKLTNILFRVDDFPCPTLGYTLVFFGSLYIKRLHISWGPEFPVQKFVTTFGHKPETTKSLEILWNPRGRKPKSRLIKWVKW